MPEQACTVHALGLPQVGQLVTIRVTGNPLVRVQRLRAIWITFDYAVNHPERPQAPDRVEWCGKLPQRTFGREYVKATILYRISSVLLLLFAAGHTLGFRKTDPKWGVDSLIGSMRSVRFDAQGFSRTYWDFYVGFGLFVSVFLVFTAVLAWQLGGLAPETLALMRGPAWALVICFAAVTILSWRYFFTAPIVFAIVITVCLTAAAWLSAKTS